MKQRRIRVQSDAWVETLPEFKATDKATRDVNVVTGAFGYTGKYITLRLLAMGKTVRTLTSHPYGTAEGWLDLSVRPGDSEIIALVRQVEAYPFNFDNPPALVASLRGASTLYNTYWIRFPHGQMTFDVAVENTKTLIRAARDAGVERIVHVSIANPSEDSPLQYYRGKTLVEGAIQESGMSYAIIRPTVIFGKEDILINNIAWLLRRFPVFPVPGRGDYRIQPIYVDDMADLAVDAGQLEENMILDAVGPDIFSFDELVRLIAQKIGRKARIIHVPVFLALWLCRVVGRFVHDVVLTLEEVDGLMSNLLVSDGRPTGRTRLGDWLESNAATVGTRYTSELTRHYR